MTKSSKRPSLALGAALTGFAILSSPAGAQRASEASYFLGAAPYTVRHQVKINQTAAGMLHNRELSALARRMAVEYDILRRDLVPFASTAHVPPIFSDLPEEHSFNAYRNYLIKVKTDEVDRAFLNVAREANARMIALYRTYATRGRDQDLVQTARAGLSILEAHRRALQGFY